MLTSHRPNNARMSPRVTWPAQLATRKVRKPMPMLPAVMVANVVNGLGSAESVKTVG